MVDYVGETKGSCRIPGIMMLGYTAAHSEVLAMAVIVSKVVTQAEFDFTLNTIYILHLCLKLSLLWCMCSSWSRMQPRTQMGGLDFIWVLHWIQIGVFLSILGYYKSNGFIWGFELGKPLNTHITPVYNSYTSLSLSCIGCLWWHEIVFWLHSIS